MLYVEKKLKILSAKFLAKNSKNFFPFYVFLVSTGRSQAHQKKSRSVQSKLVVKTYKASDVMSKFHLSEKIQNKLVFFGCVVVRNVNQNENPKENFWTMNRYYRQRKKSTTKNCKNLQKFIFEREIELRENGRISRNVVFLSENRQNFL